MIPLNNLRPLALATPNIANGPKIIATKLKFPIWKKYGKSY
jgi:hypothetical protein